jgi:hypothetical protein|nr:MAG TPA: protein-turn-helix DNA binding protein [Caudoviricetes sp.]
MIINTNSELSQAINDIIKESGYKKTYIADQLGIKNQNFNNKINKNNLSIDETNKILNIIGYDCKMIIEKTLKK